MRKKKIKVNDDNRVSSPEELDAYICIAHPGVWAGLGAVIFLLIGLFVWGFVGRVEVQVNSVSYVKEGDTNNLFTYINSRQFKNIAPNQTIRLENGKEFKLLELAKNPIEIKMDEDIVPLEVRSKGGWTYGDIIYVATSDNSIAKINSGTYSSIIVTGSMTPMSFVFNS